MKTIAIFIVYLIMTIPAHGRETFMCDSQKYYHQQQEEIRGGAAAEISRLNGVIATEQRFQQQQQTEIAKADRRVRTFGNFELRLQETENILNQVEPLLKHYLSNEPGLALLNQRLKIEMERDPETQVSALLSDAIKQAEATLSPQVKILMQDLLRWTKERESQDTEWAAQHAAVLVRLKLPEASAIPVILRAIYVSRAQNDIQTRDSRQARQELESDKTEHQRQIQQSNEKIAATNQSIAEKQAAIARTHQADIAIDDRQKSCRAAHSMPIPSERL